MGVEDKLRGDGKAKRSPTRMVKAASFGLLGICGVFCWLGWILLAKGRENDKMLPKQETRKKLEEHRWQKGLINTF